MPRSANLELLRTLKRKYGDSIAETLAYGQETAVKLDTLTHSEERGAQLDAEIGKSGVAAHSEAQIRRQHRGDPGLWAGDGRQAGYADAQRGARGATGCRDRQI